MSKIKLSLVQMSIAPGEPDYNRKNALELIDKTAIEQPDVIVLPEMWTTAYQLEKLSEICDHQGSPTMELLSKKAKEKEINIVAGSFASKEDMGIYNTAYVFDRRGNNIAKYQKIHLFKLMEEHKYLEAGNKISTFVLEGIKCGIIICYDLRFPELVRRLVLEGIQLLFVPAQWPAARLEHWVTLLKARAIENQIYIAAVNRAGDHAQDEFLGGSMIIDPWGEIIAQGTYQQQIITAEIDTMQIEQVKKKLDILADRVPSVYNEN